MGLGMRAELRTLLGGWPAGRKFLSFFSRRSGTMAANNSGKSGYKVYVMRFLVPAFVLLLAACTGPNIVSGDEVGVTVDLGVVAFRRNADMRVVGEVASRHCAKFDKDARFTGFGRKDGRLALFLCDER